MPKATQTGGTAKFTQKGNEVVMKLDVTNLTPGIHAVHIHEKGDCSAADGTSTEDTGIHQKRSRKMGC
jgi:Cu-Zn family superoxide dismutase